MNIPKALMILPIAGYFFIGSVVLAEEEKKAADKPEVDAAKAREILTKNACTACHNEETKIVGPAYKDVAAKYKDDPEAAKKLFDKVRAGGQGTWGEVPMPPQTTISDDELKLVVNFILSIK
ncbi:MAG: c-type cytochrome [Planctomycetota bacterium]